MGIVDSNFSGNLRMTTPILRLTDIHKSYKLNTEVETEVLHGISISAAERQIRRAQGAIGVGQKHVVQHHRGAHDPGSGEARSKYWRQ